MELFYYKTPEELNGFISSEYLQAWQWGEILRAEGQEILRVGVLESSASARGARKILAAATLVKQELRSGYFYWYAPRGPIFRADAETDNQKIAEFLFNEIKKLDKRAVFLRIEPKENLTGSAFSLKKTLDLQPAKTLMLDLSLGEEELLQAMGQKTRYNIRLAEKKGVKVRVGTAADFAQFWRLLNLTGERDGFRIHGAGHYEKMLAAPDGFIKLFLAQYEEKIIAAGLFCWFSGRVTYLHGASDNEFRSAMAPYLLQWSVIKLARAAGFRSYDFYGIDEQKWPGVTRFKLGYGGAREEYPGTYDVIFKAALYETYSWVRKLRRLKK